MGIHDGTCVILIIKKPVTIHRVTKRIKGCIIDGIDSRSVKICSRGEVSNIQKCNCQ